MNGFTSRFPALAVKTGLIAALAAGIPAKAEFLVITRQPDDQMVSVGSRATFLVEAEAGCAVQWLRNGMALNGQTNCSFTIDKAGVNDAGIYTCIVSKDTETVPSRPASLNVFLTPLDGGGGTTVYGTPVVGSGSSGTCPGPYAGYVSYLNTNGVWLGWSPSTNTTNHTAADGTTRTDTKVQFTGRKGDHNCNQTSVSVPDPCISTNYRFTIYFPTNVPTTNYPIILNGFTP